jgi:hypothetical protein
MKNGKLKIIIDILIFLILILELVPTEIIPVYTHYFFGLIFTVLILIHIFLNRKWCVSITKAFISGKPNRKTKRQYRTDLLLLLLWILITISGFSAMGYTMGAGEEFVIFKSIHVVFSRISGLIILIHLYQHKGQIRSYFKKMSGKASPR